MYPWGYIGGNYCIIYKRLYFGHKLLLVYFCLLGDSVSMVLLGNKIDRSSHRVITGEDGCVLSRDASMIFREVSSLDCDTVCEVYHSLAQSLVAKENEELDKFSQLTVTIRQAQNACDSSPKHGSSCYCT